MRVLNFLIPGAQVALEMFGLFWPPYILKFNWLISLTYNKLRSIGVYLLLASEMRQISACMLLFRCILCTKPAGASVLHKETSKYSIINLIHTEQEDRMIFFFLSEQVFFHLCTRQSSSWTYPPQVFTSVHLFNKIVRSRFTINSPFSITIGSRFTAAKIKLGEDSPS